MDLSDDPTLRAVVKAARAWGISPSRFMGSRPETPEWTPRDRELAFALMEYEAGLCPGGPHVLAETSKPEYEGAFVPEDPEPIRCHECTAAALLSELLEKRENPAGLLLPQLQIDPKIVEQNLKPVPPLPYELGGESDVG